MHVKTDAAVELTSPQGQFHFQRLAKGVLLVTITGNDTGQFGTRPLDEIRLEIMRYGALELFIDAEGAQLVSTEVSQEWTQFFSLSRAQLRRVSVLTGTRLINLTVAIAQHLSNTGNLIQIYSDRALFHGAIARVQR